MSSNKEALPAAFHGNCPRNLLLFQFQSFLCFTFVPSTQLLLLLLLLLVLLALTTLTSLHCKLEPFLHCPSLLPLMLPLALRYPLQNHHGNPSSPFGYHPILRR